MDLSISGITYRYPAGVHALRDVSVSIASGETVALIGRNGAGKTTLAKHLNGLLKPTTGTVRVGDWDTRTRSVAQLAERVGYAFQNPDDQLCQSTVRAEVEFGPRNLRRARSEIATQGEAALHLTGLSAFTERHPYDLSAAQRRLIVLASVLAMGTPIIVLDEPTAGLDYAGVDRVGQIVDDLRQRGKTVIAITHDLDFCAEHFARTIVMAAGTVVLDGASREVLSESNWLSQAGVDAPQVMRLAQALEWSDRPLTVDEFVASLGRKLFENS